MRKILFLLLISCNFLLADPIEIGFLGLSLVNQYSDAMNVNNNIENIKVLSFNNNKYILESQVGLMFNFRVSYPSFVSFSFLTSQSLDEINFYYGLRLLPPSFQFKIDTKLGLGLVDINKQYSFNNTKLSIVIAPTYFFEYSFFSIMTEGYIISYKFQNTYNFKIGFAFGFYL